MTVDRALPAQELIYRKLVAVTGLIETQKTTAHCGNHFGFSPNHPSLRILRRQISHCQGTAIGADDITNAGSELLIGHDTLHTLADQNCNIT